MLREAAFGYLRTSFTIYNFSVNVKLFLNKKIFKKDNKGEFHGNDI
jgi:hypothetical protein